MIRQAPYRIEVKSQLNDFAVIILCSLRLLLLLLRCVKSQKKKLYNYKIVCISCVLFTSHTNEKPAVLFFFFRLYTCSLFIPPQWSIHTHIYMYDFEYAVRFFSSSSLSQCACCLGVHLPYIPFGWMKQYIEILLLLLLMVWALVVVVLCFFIFFLFHFISAFSLFYLVKSLVHTFCAVFNCKFMRARHKIVCPGFVLLWWSCRG